MDEDEDSNTALHLACMNRRYKCVKYTFPSRDVEVNSLIRGRISRCVEKLLEYGADVQSRNAKKWTPLDCAAAAGAYNCAKLLLDVSNDTYCRLNNTPSKLHLFL